MKRWVALVLTILLLPFSGFAADNEKEADRVQDAGTVLKEILDIPDDIPKDLVDKAECVIVLPSVKKAAFGIGASYGRGVMTCRSGQHYTGPWTAPALYALEGANIGFQLGLQGTDFVILVMNPSGAKSLLSSKVKLGADASAAAGPKGRSADAATDVVMRAEMLSYSRSRGLFAGVSLEGSTLRSDNRANRKLYGREITAKEILRQGRVGAPASAHELLALLNRYSPKNKSDPKSLE
jgi:SH3 domain-containing YSC84-like protein 1